MGIENFIPELWSNLIQKTLDKTMVYGSCANTDHEGQIRRMGDKVRILELGPVAVKPYVKNSTVISYDGLTDASKFLEISQSKHFAFKLDDVDAAQSSAGVMAAASQSAAYAMADAIDQYLATMYAKAGVVSNLGTSGTPIEVNSKNISLYLLKVARMLDDQNVPRAGRFIVIPPFMLEDLAIANLAAYTDNMNVAANGLVGRYAGFDIKVSNNVPNTSKAKYACIAGTNAAISFAHQVSDVEALRLEGSFSNAVRGLSLYGAEVVMPNAIACLWANEAAE